VEQEEADFTDEHRLAVSRFDGYDQEKAERASFLTCRTRYLRRTRPIVPTAPPEGQRVYSS